MKFLTKHLPYCLSFFLIISLAFVSCNEDEVELTLNDKVRSISSYTENFPPFNFEANGELRGISSELLAAMLTDMGINLYSVSVQMGEWSEIYDHVLNNQNTMLFSTVRTPEREDLFKWVGPIALHKDKIISKAGSSVTIQNASDLQNYSYAVIEGYSTIEELENEGVPSANLLQVESVEELYNALMNSDVDCIAYSEMGHNLISISLGYSEEDFEMEFDLLVLELYYAFNSNTAAEVINYFQLTFEELKEDKTGGSSVYEQIMNDYNVIQSFEDGLNDDMCIELVNYTSEEITEEAFATFDKINMGLSPYHSNENSALYCFVYDTNLTIVAHATNPYIVGVNFKGKPDASGKLFRDEILAGAMAQDTGWVDYIYTRPDEPGLYQKTTYYKLTQGDDGKQYIVCSGRYK